MFSDFVYKIKTILLRIDQKKIFILKYYKYVLYVGSSSCTLP